MILYVPGLQSLFDVHMPELIDWAIAALFAAIVFATIEIGKYVTSRRRNASGFQSFIKKYAEFS